MKKRQGGLKNSIMPTKLSTLVSKIQTVPNPRNAKLVEEMYEYLKSNGVSERHQYNALKVIIPFADYLGSATSFFGTSQLRACSSR
jgi:hypothetical protein